MRKHSEILAEAKDIMTNNATAGTLCDSNQCYCLLGAVYAAETGARGDEVNARCEDGESHHYGTPLAYSDRPVLAPLAQAIRELGYDEHRDNVDIIWNFNDDRQHHTRFLTPAVSAALDRAIEIAKQQEAHTDA